VSAAANRRELPQVGLVYLVRHRNGPGPFDAFLDSYREHESGTPHDLILAFKGFNDPAELREYRSSARDLPHSALRLPDQGVDLQTYVAVARQIEHEYVCFVNSFSVILAPGWLSLLLSAAKEPMVGAAGASGSWESPYSHLTAVHRGNRGGSPSSRLRRIRGYFVLLRKQREYPEFPNPHLRTNAFLMRRDRFLSLSIPKRVGKAAAARVESGRRSITRQLGKQGLAPVVAGRDGRSFAPADWPDSCTFRQGDQINLLVADNRTQQYASASTELRAGLAELAWGVS
jgi:hypothetical protein